MNASRPGAEREIDVRDGEVSGPRPANDEGPMRLSMGRSYGTSAVAVEGRVRVLVHILLLLGVALMTAPDCMGSGAGASANQADQGGRARRFASAGLGLSAAAAFPEQLQKALKANGIEVEMINAGVSGDTSSGGRDRLDWSVPDGTDAVILELGANDALRGTDPKGYPRWRCRISWRG